MRLLVHFDRPELFIDILEDRFPQIEVVCWCDYAGFGETLSSFEPEILFNIKFEDKPYPSQAIAKCKSLRWINVGGAGVDHIPIWDPERLTVTNGAGVASDVMASYAIGAVIALSMEFPRFARQQQARLWKSHYISSPEGKTLAVIGLGHVGRAVAKRAKSLGMRVIGTRANPEETEFVDQVFNASKLHEALREADFVVVSCPLLSNTRKMIDEDAFGAMKDGAYLIDISRGGIVDASALIESLKCKKLAGAVLDVFETEPMPPDCPLWDMENVLITPHNCAIFDGWEPAERQILLAQAPRCPVVPDSQAVDHPCGDVCCSKAFRVVGNLIIR